jgi:hypothetical protein
MLFLLLVCMHVTILNRVKKLGEFETKPHAFLVGVIVLESLRLLDEVVSVRGSKLVDTARFHLLKGRRVSDQPVRQTLFHDVVRVVVVSQLNMLNIGAIMIREQLGNISIGGGTGSSDLVDGVPVLLVVQENNHGRVSDIVGTHVIDAHSVRRGDELVLLGKKVTLMERECRH